MTRKKKERRTGHFMAVLEPTKPKKQERLADPTSKEARRAKALRERKKQKSVYEKAQGTQTRRDRDLEAGRRGTRHGGPLADKIRKLNRHNSSDEGETQA